MMRIFHRTSAADTILREGFRDGTGIYLTDQEHTGVWMSERPLDANEGAFGIHLLVLEVPEELLLPCEWEQDIGYREFLVPAEVLNRFGPPTECSDEEAWDWRENR